MFAEDREHKAVAEKETKKQIKRLKQKAKKATAAILVLEKRVRKLMKKLDARKQQLADLQGSLIRTPSITEVKSASTPEFGDRDGTGIAVSHRSAWKQHRYLRDRYEFHLDAGATAERARYLANEDLKQAYETDCGYTEEELSAILS